MTLVFVYFSALLCLAVIVAGIAAIREGQGWVGLFILLLSPISLAMLVMTIKTGLRHGWG